MFVPGHNERLLRSAMRSQADVLLLDLEDSVQPRTNKVVARELIRRFVLDGAFGGKGIFPRVNDRESGELLRDVHELTIQGVDGFLYPKAKSRDDIYFFDKLLETIEYEKGFARGTFKIIVLIETAAAVMNVQGICQASDRVVAIAYGCEDFITDLQGIHDSDEMSLFVPRARIAMAARAHGVVPIDTVHINVHDLEDLQKNLEIARTLGFEGMLVLNPKEIELVHRMFTPSLEQVNSAREVVELAEQAMREGIGVAIRNGKFLGPPIVAAARSLLSRHEKVQKRLQDLDASEVLVPIETSLKGEVAR